MKKLFAILLTMAMSLSLVACGTDKAPAISVTETYYVEPPAMEEPDANGYIYYLNFKPEQHQMWQDMADEYAEKTGIPVIVMTVASGIYEDVLLTELEKETPPTLFQVNGPVGLSRYIDYCYDLSDSELYRHLTSDDYALKEETAVLGIAYVIESYGIIANKTLLEKAGYRAEDIQSFADLKVVAEDITARSVSLGFSAFSSAGMDSSSAWRFQTHLANLPIYFEYQKKGVEMTENIQGMYLDHYRKIWDLYINNATCSPVELADKTGDDSLCEFLYGKAAFYQNGSWAYRDISEAFSDAELQMLPIYIDAGEESKQGLCTGTENYWCVNRKVSQKDMDATLDFLNWCITERADVMAQDMGFDIPFDTAVESSNLFVKQNAAYMEEGRKPIPWSFTTIPSEAWKDRVGDALLTYAAEQTDENWNAVVAAFVDGWASAYETQ